MPIKSDITQVSICYINSEGEYKPIGHIGAEDRELGSEMPYDASASGLSGEWTFEVNLERRSFGRLMKLIRFPKKARRRARRLKREGFRLMET